MKGQPGRWQKLLVGWLGMILIAAWVMPIGAYAQDDGQKNAAKPALKLASSARSAVLMDASTGTVLFEKNSHEEFPPASVTKIMTMLLIMDALDSGKLKLSDKVATSEYAASMGGSQIFLEPGEEMTVDDMLKGIALASGNDASVAMAEKIAGSEDMFVQMMNDKAKELGLKNTHFVNCNGLPAADHYSSAYDIALMSKALLEHPAITKYTGKYQDYLRKDTDNPFWLVNTNKLVRFYDGADGLKTGYTSEAKFCLSATAERSGFRVIAVVMGEPSTKTRNAEVTQMLNYAFSQYTTHTIFKTGDTIGEIPVAKGENKTLVLKAAHPYSVLMKKGTDASGVTYKVNALKLKAPVAQGQTVGQLVVYHQNEIMAQFDLKAPIEVKKAGWWKLFKRTCGKLFFLD